MLSRKITGTTRTLGKSQGYIGLPVRDTESGGLPVMETAWEPTPDELAAINAGGSIILRVLGDAHPPVMLYAESPNAGE